MDLLAATDGSVPVVFDRLHWEANPRSASYEAELGEALRSWPRGRVAELHYSEQAEGKPRGAHAEYVTGRGLLRFLQEVAEIAAGREVVVIVEAKKKDIAITRAIAELSPRLHAKLRAIVPDLARSSISAAPA